MSPAEWWRGAVIYQIYPRSFSDSNGDGIGDLPGVIGRLDHIARLGADAVWLCPFFTSPQQDFGYDVSDHLAVDPIFGTLDDFDRLVARAHQLGLRVLIDQVWSHTSNQHAWFLDSRASRSSDHADWYVWADPAEDGTPPNNWLSVFGGAAWTWEPRRRQYYLHHFLTCQPALNLHNPAVVDAILAGGEFWLKRGVDGFRLDAVDFMMHDEQLRSNPPALRVAGAATPAKLFGLQRHQFDMLQPGAMGVLARIRALLERYPGTVSLGEASSQDGAFERVQGYTAGPTYLHMAYTLRPLRGGFDWPTVRGLLRDVANAPLGWPCWSFSNHDVERAITRWHPRGKSAGHDRAFAQLLMAFLLTLRGSVTLYQGEELGLTEAELSFEQMRDPFGIAYWPEFRGRDGSRTPLPWTQHGPHAGFTDGAEPWLPVAPSHRALAVDVQDNQPSLLNDWRHFLAWRRTRPALLRGTLRPVDLAEPLVGFVRELDGERILLVFNLSETAVTADLSAFSGLTVMADSGFAPALDSGQAALPGFGVMMAALAATHAQETLPDLLEAAD